MNEKISESTYDDEEDKDIELTEDYGMILKKSESNKLWARAVAKCSICKIDLFKKECSDTNIGVECHICSEKPDIPSKEFSRYDPNLAPEKRDKSYDNAILLCRNCHAIIDDTKNTQYTIEELHRTKEKHEADVKTGVGESKDTKLDPEVAKEHSERRKQLHGWIHEHNQKLIGTVIKPWYEDKFVSYTNEPFATEHLQTGYVDIWKLRLECKTLKDNVLSEENAIRGYIKNRLEEELPQNFEQDLSFVNEGVLHGNFTSDDVVNSIYNTVEKFSKKDGVPGNYRLDNNFGISVLVDKKRADLVEKLENFKKFVETTIKDKNLYGRFETLNKSRKLSYKKIDEFYQGLKQIEYDFEERHIELQGTCKICKDWYEELKSLK